VRITKLWLIVFVFTILMMSAPLAAQDSPLTIEVLGTYTTGVFAESAAEEAAYDAATQRLFVVNGADVSIDILDITDPTAPTLVSRIDVSSFGAGVNNVAFANGVVAIAIEPEATDAAGVVVFADAEGAVLGSVEVGSQPDSLTFTPDGMKIVTANEGEPNGEYTIDPEGSISIIDLTGGVETAVVTTLGFTDFNTDGARAAELPAEVRIYGPNATVAQDLEPEYVTITPDGATALVTLQEANAVAVVDIAAAQIAEIRALGFKDHTLEGNGLDVSNEDGMINIANWPVLGMYQPDGIRAFEVAGSVYYITANEGDTRDYDGYTEEGEVSEMTLDPEAFPNAAELQEEANLGKLETVISYGDADGDGDFEQLYVPGGRSFSIHALDGTLVYDSGDLIEQVTAEAIPDFFNTDNEVNELEDRSDNKGPEPEEVAVGVIGDATYAFVGLERTSGIVVVDISDPAVPVFVTYVNNRDFAGDPEAGTAGDLGPEGIIFIPAAQSPNGSDLLVVANEISGSTTIYQISAGM
jgi:DNA-binding beta-propeller fold protein YncE